jgi:hypothetical protein
MIRHIGGPPSGAYIAAGPSVTSSASGKSGATTWPRSQVRDGECIPWTGSVGPVGCGLPAAEGRRVLGAEASQDWVNRAGPVCSAAGGYCVGVGLLELRASRAPWIICALRRSLGGRTAGCLSWRVART